MKTNRWLIAALLLLPLLLLAGSCVFSGLKMQRLKAEAEVSPLACAYYAATRSGELNGDELAKVAVAYAEAGDFGHAIQVLDSIREYEYFALNPFRFRKPVVPNLSAKVKAMADIAGIYTRSGQKEQALKTLSEATQIADKLESIYEQIWAWPEVCFRYVELGDDKKTLLMAESITSDRFRQQEDAGAFKAQFLNQVAEQCAGASREKEAKIYLDLAVQVSDTIRDEPLKVQSLTESAGIYGRLREKVRSTELLERAFQKASAISNKYWSRDSVLRDVAGKYAETGNFDRAVEIAGLIEGSHIRPNAQASIMRELIRAGQLEQAVQMRETVQAEGADDLLADIVAAYLENGSRDMAWQTFTRITDHREKAKALIVIANNYAETGETGRTATLLAQAVQEARSVSYGADTWWLVKAAACYFRIQERTTAAEIVSEVGQMRDSAYSLADAAIEIAKDGDYDAAIEIIRSIVTEIVVDDIGTFPPEQYRAEAVTEVAIQYFKSGRQATNETQRLLRELVILSG